MVCIYSMYSVTKGEDVNGTAKFCVPWDVSFETVCHQLYSAGQHGAVKVQLKVHLVGNGQ